MHIILGHVIPRMDIALSPKFSTSGIAPFPRVDLPQTLHAGKMQVRPMGRKFGMTFYSICPIPNTMYRASRAERYPPFRTSSARLEQFS